MNSLTTAGLCVIVGIAGFGAFYRYKQIAALPFGTGCSVVSPKGRYRAYSTEFIDESFWSRETRFYGFEIEECQTGRSVVQHYTPRMARQQNEEFVSEVHICWAPDAQRVSVDRGGRILWEYHLDHPV